MKKNSFIKSAVLSVAAPLIVLVCVEILAHLVLLDIKVIYQLHPVYLYVTKADFKRSIFNKRTGQKIFFRTSSLGYRGDFKTQKNAPRAIVYGDSNVQALFEPEEETFPFQLEKSLKKKGLSFEVINAGTAGYGPDQNLMRLKNDISFFCGQ